MDSSACNKGRHDFGRPEGMELVDGKPVGTIPMDAKCQGCGQTAEAIIKAASDGPLGLSVSFHAIGPAAVNPKDVK